MTTKLIVRDGQIIGTTTPDDPNGYTLIEPPPGFDGDFEAIVYDPSTGTAQFVLEYFKARRIREIKEAAKKQIEALAWRIERADERERLGLPGETVTEVLLEREAIRRASNRCEAEILAAQDKAAVQAVVFAVTEADRAIRKRLSRLEFLARFSDAEMRAILSAAETNAAIRSLVLRWQAAEGIVLTDPATVAAVGALEAAGLIAQGRSEQILSSL